jgi:hypothetical protein
MTAFRFFTIIVIFTGVSCAWLVLGTTIEYRTAAFDRGLAEEVSARWGASSLVQPAPYLLTGLAGDTPRSGTVVDPAASAITADFVHEQRYMGLLWFSTYTVRFSGEYTVQTTAVEKPAGTDFVFRLPEHVRAFEDLTVTLDHQPYALQGSGAADGTLRIAVPGDNKPHTVSVAYAARGRDRWEYAIGNEERGRIPLIQGFTLTATMNFRDIDYPKGSISPVKKAEETKSGMQATWQYNNLRASQRMGIEMPPVPEAGEVAARMSYFAPVSLLFFFTVLFAITLLKQVPLHPMHYLFISAGFFAFHILLAYLVDRIPLGQAFWICAAVSVFLVVSYVRLVAGVKFAVVYVGAAQVVYLIGFSYAFLWKGNTGLTVVIGAIATLFVLMQATGMVIWNEVFGKPAARPPAPSVPPAAPPGATAGSATPPKAGKL